MKNLLKSPDRQLECSLRTSRLISCPGVPCSMSGTFCSLWDCRGWSPWPQLRQMLVFFFLTLDGTSTYIQSIYRKTFIEAFCSCFFRTYAFYVWFVEDILLPSACFSEQSQQTELWHIKNPSVWIIWISLNVPTRRPLGIGQPRLTDQQKISKGLFGFQMLALLNVMWVGLYDLFCWWTFSHVQQSVTSQRLSDSIQQLFFTRWSHFSLYNNIFITKSLFVLPQRSWLLD